MSDELIVRLRREVETQHAEAIHAIGVLEKYLASTTATLLHHEKANKSGKKKTQRELVLDVLRRRPGSGIDELVRDTGLNKAKVRGVLYAPMLKKRIKSEVNGDGYAKYTLIEKQ